MNQILHSNIITISTFLNLQDLLNLSSTCKHCSSILNLELIWSNILSISGLVSPTIIECKPTTLSSQAYFKQTYDLFKKIKRSLYEISKKLNYDEYFNIKKSLLTFLTPNKSRINSLNQTINASYGSIPLSYFLLYYLMNGQNNLDCLGANYNLSAPKAVFGGFSYYYDYYEFFFLPLETFLCGFLKELKFHPIARENHNFFLFNDFGNFLGFGSKAVFSFIAKNNTPNGWIYTIYVMHENLLSFLNEVSRLPYDSNEEKLYLDHFDTLNNPCSDVTTQGIRVRAKAIFNPWDQRAEGKHFFPYQIRISDAGVQKPVRLVSRKWVIKDGENVETIEGEGVIGKYPLISSACEDFVYESVSPIGGFEGSMEGSFMFEAMDGSNEMIEVKVGKFLFKIEEGKKILKVNLEKKEIVRVI